MSTILAVLALLLSIGTFYYTNVYVDIDSQARVLQPVLRGGPTGQTSVLEMPVALVNAGNRPSIVVNASYALGNSANNPNRRKELDLGEQLPVLLPPREVRVIRLDIPIRAALDAEIKAAASRNGKISDAHHVFVELTTIDSTGAQTWTVSPSIITARLKPNGRISGFSNDDLDAANAPFSLTNPKRDAIARRTKLASAGEDSNMVLDESETR